MNTVMSATSIGLVSVAFQVLWFVGALVLTVLLIVAYSKQKHAGFLWLLAATVVWPLITRVATMGLTMSLPAIAARDGYPIQTIAVIQIGFSGVMSFVDVVLLIIAAQRFLAGYQRAGVQ